EVIHRTSKLCSKQDSGHILNQILIIIREKKLHTATEIINYIYRSQERVDTIHSEDLFTTQEQRSTRMLLVGGAGTGKSYISRRLLQKWASGKNKLFYSCVVYIPFSDLNCIEQPIDVRELLAYKCKELSPVLTDLLNNNQILIILDGLDEFKYDLNYTQYHSSREVDTIDVALPINTLVSKLITRDLLPDIDVLVTAQFHSVSEICKHFNYVFVSLGCTADYIKQYYDTFTLVNQTLKHNSNSASWCELLAMYLFPLQIKILRDTLMEISKSRDIREHNSARVFITRGESKENCCVSIESGEMDTTGFLPSLELPGHVKEIIYRLGKVSYECLLTGVQELKREDLERCHIDPKLLTKYFSSFISQVKRGGEIFAYCHDGARDMFAALYCVQEIQDGEELKQCLDAWVLGHILASYKEESLLKKVTLNHVEKLHNFIRFFMGLLPYRRIESLLHDPVLLNGAIRNSLLEWFRHCAVRDLSQMTTLNLLHCIFELHDASLTGDVSRYFKHIFLYNTPLSAADIGTLHYSLEKTTPDTVDLRGCGLGDAGLEQLSSVIRSSREVWISYNKLTEKSGRILQNVLEHPGCAMESLS
ncbi:nucleotide binding oligomerization domain containing 2, partial [Chelydra serpentina]